MYPYIYIVEWTIINLINLTEKIKKKKSRKRLTKTIQIVIFFMLIRYYVLSWKFLDFNPRPWSTLNARLDVRHSSQGYVRAAGSICSITPREVVDAWEEGNELKTLRDRRPRSFYRRRQNALSLFHTHTRIYRLRLL